MNTKYLDITKDHCPMTFVKTALELEKLESGDRLEVKLNEGEPLNNVPRTVEERGFTIIEMVRVENKVHKILIEKG